MSNDIPPRRESDRPVDASDATRPMTPVERDEAAYRDDATYTDDRGRVVDRDGVAYDDRPVRDERAAYDDRATYDGRPVREDRAAYDAAPGAAAATTAAGTRTVVADDSADARSLRHEVLAREKERFGGFHFGSAFFGWIAAMGLAVLLTALVAAIGGAIGLSSPQTVEDAAAAAEQNMGTATIIGAIVVAVVLFVAYFAGGYVAGRMARFSGLKQGLAVWLWAIVIAILVALITAIAGTQWDVLANLDTFPRIPVSPDAATLTGILTALGAAIITLAGALLGGVAGERYHRRVDRVGLGA